MPAWAWILVIAAIVVVIASIAALVIRERRSTTLRRRFGPEYDRTVESADDRRAAESQLRDRQRYRARFDVKPLPEPARARFATEWRGVQERFVDQPANAVVAADALVQQVMGARGYPMEKFEAQADLISVDHPDVVENYRSAHGVYTRAQRQQASTEDLRAAMLHYRTLFDHLLQPESGDDDGRQVAETEHHPIGRSK
jgi:hypothetical protein